MFLVALAAVSFASCSHDEVVELKQDQIKFSAVANKASRATITTTSSLTEFKTYAVVEEDGGITYIDGLTAQKNGTVFDFANEDEVFYWPKNKTDFQFVAPTTYSIVNNQIVDYVCSDAKQDDLIYAAAYDEDKPGSGDGVLPINFRHALAQLQFNIKSLGGDYKLDVKVKGITLVNVRRQGTFTMPTSDTNVPNYSPSDNKSDTETNESWGKWAFNDGIDAEKAIYTYFYKNDARLVADASAGTDVVTTVTEATDNILIMPQQFTPSTPENGPWKNTYFLLDVLVKKNGVTIEEGEVAVPAKAEIDALDPTKHVWKQGKKYVYTFIFGAGAGFIKDTDDPTLIPISFNVTVDEFQTADVDVEMPKYE